MTTLTWTDDLALGQPHMDATHVGFVERLAALGRALDTPAAVAPALAALVDHTADHFAQEERWMTALGFAPQNCHALQHQTVMNVLREVQRQHASTADQADQAAVRLLVDELAVWFPQHAQMMDAALAETMAVRGYDPQTGAMTHPPAPQSL